MLTSERATPAIIGPLVATQGPKIASNTIIYRGAMVGLDASGNAIPAGPDAVAVLGRAARTVDNRTGSDPNASKIVHLEYGTFAWTNGDSITAGDFGRAVYAGDDETVYLSASGGRPFAGIVEDVVTGNGERSGVWVRQYAEPGPFVREASLTVTFEDLTAAATSESLAIDTLPAGAFVLGFGVDLTTPFTGGSATAVTVDVGTSTDPDAIADGVDVFAAAVGGKASDAPAGIASQGSYSGAALEALFTSDVNVAALTAGEATIRIAYAVL